MTDGEVAARLVRRNTLYLLIAHVLDAPLSVIANLLAMTCCAAASALTLAQ